MLPAMQPTKKRYLVDDVEVTLVQDDQGVRWQCASCEGSCQHMLQAAAWVTLESWKGQERVELH
jgi:hypothetical protein